MIKDYKINILSRDEYGRPSGIVAVNKPADITSHDIVNQLRKQLNTRKVGHAGALDVFAQGLMIYLIGKATKLSDKIIHLDKEYITTIVFGIATNTQDTEGDITEIKTGYSISGLGDIEQTLKEFEGKRKQYVSVFSSVKVGGKKLRVLMRDNNYEKNINYDKDSNKQITFIPVDKESAQKPFSIKVPSKEITLYSIVLIEKGDTAVSDMDKLAKKLNTLPPTQTFPYIKVRIKSSKGTYIRQLAEDIGEKLNMPAMLLSLTRTKIGSITLEDCLPVEEIK